MTAGWALSGVVIGALAAALSQAPAAWLAHAVEAGSGARFLLADARGTVWSGSALPVLTGGPGSRDASALPGRLQWRIRPDGAAFLVLARHDCCLNGTLRLRVAPGWGRLRIELQRPEGGAAVGQWPASWLAGLGTPWNTLQPGGSLLLASPGLVLEARGGQWELGGRAVLELNAFSSRVSTLDVLGSYRLTLEGDGVGGAPARLALVTTTGALQLEGSGQLLGAGASPALRFRGTASAAPGHEAVLNNLLNVIGRRQGAQALISIG